MKVRVRKCSVANSKRRVHLWDSFCIAFSMYCVIPVPAARWTDENKRYIFCFFPLVGVVIGGAVWIWYRFCVAIGQPMLFAAGASALPVLLSGGIHLDGFCDVSDALGANASPEKSLEIMKDSRSGAFALMKCVLWGMMSFALWHIYYQNPIPRMLLIFILSRALSGLGVLCIPCAKGSGLASAFAGSADKAPVILTLCGYIVVCLGGMFLGNTFCGLACSIAMGAFFYGYRYMACKRFGGVTGDLAGWFLVLAELILVGVSVLWGGITW